MAGRPYGCIETNPTPQSVQFCGEYINLKEMARLYGMDHSYLSRIFNFTRVPSADYAKRIAAALHMSYDDFLEGLQLEQRESLTRKVG